MQPSPALEKMIAAGKLGVGFQNHGTPDLQNHSPWDPSPRDGWNVVYAAACCRETSLGLSRGRYDSPSMTRSSALLVKRSMPLWARIASAKVASRSSGPRLEVTIIEPV